MPLLLLLFLLFLLLLLLLRVRHIHQRSAAAAWALPCRNDCQLLLLLVLLHPLHVCGERVQRCLQLFRLLPLRCQRLLQGGSIWCWGMLLLHKQGI
jgi:hypothetical protein